MISIGEFALSTGLSVKALRFYDERGLLSGGGMLDDGPSASADAVRFRTAERAGWVAVVEQRLALPVDGELPEGFAVPGLRIASGVLPRREEAAVTVRVLD